MFISDVTNSKSTYYSHAHYDSVQANSIIIYHCVYMRARKPK